MRKFICLIAMLNLVSMPSMARPLTDAEHEIARKAFLTGLLAGASGKLSVESATRDFHRLRFSVADYTDHSFRFTAKNHNTLILEYVGNPLGGETGEITTGR